MLGASFRLFCVDNRDDKTIQERHRLYCDFNLWQKPLELLSEKLLKMFGIIVKKTIP